MKNPPTISVNVHESKSVKALIRAYKVLMDEMKKITLDEELGRSIRARAWVAIKAAREILSGDYYEA